MKVLYITPHLSTGGAPRYLLEKIKLLNDTCDIYCIEYVDITGGILVVQKTEIKKLLGEKLITIGENKSQIIEEIKKIDPDVIHFEEMPEYFCDYEVAKAIYAPTRRYKIFETSHDSSFNPEGKLFFPDKFLFVSEYQRQMMKSINVDSEVVEFPITYKTKSDREQALKELDLDPNFIHIINVGLFTARKNQKEAIDYARKLTHLPVKFHFIGSLADNFKCYWEEAIKDLPPNCKIWGERSDVDNFYNAADLFFFASRGFENDKETSPLVIKECIGWNLPIFLYNLPVYCNMYDNYKNMLFLSLDKDVNLKSLSDKIIELYNDKIVKYVNADDYGLNFQFKDGHSLFYVHTNKRLKHDKQKLNIVFKDVDSLTTFYSSTHHHFDSCMNYYFLPMFHYNFLEDKSFRGFIVEFYDLTNKLLFSKEMFIKNSEKNPEKIEFSLKHPFDRTWWNYEEFFITKVIENNFPSLKLNTLKTILDVGANNGVFTEKMLRNGAEKIYCFEPNPNALINLYDRYSKNDKIKIVNKAASNKLQKLNFHFHPENSTISALDRNHLIPHLPSEQLTSCEVDCIRLDDYCNENNIEEIDLLKMDIEGAEYDALQSLNTDFFKKVKYMLIETHENTIENQKCKNLVQFLRQNDFIINEFVISAYKNCSEEEVYGSSVGTFLAVNKNSLNNLLTVVIPTYNHEKYIEQCVDSVLMQKTDIDFNVIISDDCSKDETYKLIQKYKNIKNVTIHKTETNQGSTLKRMKDLISLCKTKYISFLDGDDYYLAVDKLQIQINFLERNDEYVLHSPTYSYTKDGQRLHSTIRELEFSQNIFANYISCGVMYRNDILQKNFNLFDKYDHEEIFDPYWVIPLLLLQFGKGYNEHEGQQSVVYRLHESSEFSHLNELEKTKKVLKQGRKLAQIHDADLLNQTLKIKRNKNIIDFYTETKNASFDGFIDVYDASNGNIIFQKKQIGFSAFSIEGKEFDSNAITYNWLSMDILNDIKVKIDFFDRNKKFIFSKDSSFVKPAIVTDVFFHTQVTYDNFIQFADNMKKTGFPLLLMTNSKFDSKVLDYVDYLIYDKEDRLFQHEYENYKPLFLFFKSAFHSFEIPTVGKQIHGLSVISNFYRSLEFLKTLNYTHIIKIEADCMIEKTDKISEQLQNMIDADKKGLIYLHDDNGDLFTSCHILYYEIDFLLSLFPKINNEKDYKNYINCKKFISAEELLTQIFVKKRDEVIIKDSNLLFSDYGNSLWNRIMTPLESDKIINGCVPNVFRVYQNDQLLEDTFAIALVDMCRGQKNDCRFVVETDGQQKEYIFDVNESKTYDFQLIKFNKIPTKVKIIKDKFEKTILINNVFEIDNVLKILQ